MKRIVVFEYLTGGGDGVDDALLPAGRAMRDAIVGDLLRSGHAVSAAASDGVLPAGAAALPAAAGESAFERVARAARSHDAVWVVAPETGGLLERFARCVPAAQWIGCDAAAIALASSKRATLHRLAAHGVQTPLAFERDATRWVVKPDDGAGAVDTVVHADLGAAQAAQRARPPRAATLEPWVDGDALSLSLLCRAGRAELLSVNRQRIDVGADGAVAYRGVDRVAAVGARLHAALAALAARIAGAIPGLRGFVGVDVVRHPVRGPVAIEVNPRVTCAYVGLSAALARPLGAEIVAAAALEPAHAGG